MIKDLQVDITILEPKVILQSGIARDYIYDLTEDYWESIAIIVFADFQEYESLSIVPNNIKTESHKDRCIIFDGDDDYHIFHTDVWNNIWSYLYEKLDNDETHPPHPVDICDEIGERRYIDTISDELVYSFTILKNPKF